jgi:hypothetical protein
MVLTTSTGRELEVSKPIELRGESVRRLGFDQVKFAVKLLRDCKMSRRLFRFPIVGGTPAKLGPLLHGLI